MSRINDELLAGAVRGFLMEKHVPFSELDAWTDEIVAIAHDHPVTDVAAARLVDDLAAIVRRFIGGWVLLSTVDGPEWHSDPALDEEEDGEYQPVAEPLTSGEVAALRHARQQERRITVNAAPLRVEPIPTCRSCGKRAPWCSCGAMDYDHARQQEETGG